MDIRLNSRLNSNKKNKLVDKKKGFKKDLSENILERKKLQKII